MLDPEEFAEYEAWRQHRLTASTDISVQAFNVEMESTALAWQAGWKARDAGKPIEANEYRGPGMRGEVRSATHLPSGEPDDETPF